MRYEGWADRVEIPTPGRPSAGIVSLVRRWLDPLVRAFHRPVLEGVEHLPAQGAFVLASNHPAGLGASEILAFIACYLRQVGPDRPLAGFAHPLAYRVPPVAAFY